MITKIIDMEFKTDILGAVGNDLWYYDYRYVWRYDTVTREKESFPLPEERVVHLFHHQAGGKIHVLTYPGSFYFDTGQRTWEKIPEKLGLKGFSFHSFSSSDDGFWVFGNYFLGEIQTCCGICDRDYFRFDLVEKQWMKYPTMDFHGSKMDNVFSLWHNKYSKRYLYGIDSRGFYKVAVETGEYSHYHDRTRGPLKNPIACCTTDKYGQTVDISAGDVWFAVNKIKVKKTFSLFCFDDTDGTLEETFKLKVDFARGMFNDHFLDPVHFLSIDPDKRRRLWLGTLKGLWLLDIDESIMMPLELPGSSHVDQEILSLCFDPETSDLLVAAWDGIYRISRNEIERRIGGSDRDSRDYVVRKTSARRMFVKPSRKSMRALPKVRSDKGLKLLWQKDLREEIRAFRLKKHQIDVRTKKTLFSLDDGTGKVKSRRSINEVMNKCITSTRDEDICLTDNAIVALSRETGDVAWEYPLDCSMENHMRSGDLLLLRSWDTIHTFDLAKRTIVDSFDLEKKTFEPSWHEPRFETWFPENHVVIRWRKVLSAYDLESHRPVWSRIWDRQDVNWCRYVNEKLLVKVHIIQLRKDYRHNTFLTLLDPGTGRTEWERFFKNSYWSCVIFDKDALYVGVWEGLHKIDFLTGETVWKNSTDNFCRGTLKTDNDRVFYISEQKVLFLVDKSTGKLNRLSRFQGQKFWGNLIMFDGHDLYVEHDVTVVSKYRISGNPSEGGGK